MQGSLDQQLRIETRGETRLPVEVVIESPCGALQTESRLADSVSNFAEGTYLGTRFHGESPVDRPPPAGPNTEGLHERPCVDRQSI